MERLAIYDLRFTNRGRFRAAARRVNRKSQIVNSFDRVDQRRQPLNASWRRKFAVPVHRESPGIRTVAVPSPTRYTVGVNRLTKQEQLVLGVVLGLLLIGWAVKSYRAAHPPAPAVSPAAS